jgi:hypothetical protein
MSEKALQKTINKGRVIFLRKYQIKYERRTFTGWARCFSCPGCIDDVDILGILYEGENVRGRICEKCLGQGKDGFPSVLKRYAEWLRGYAEYLEDLANTEIGFPSPKDFERLEEEYE